VVRVLPDEPAIDREFDYLLPDDLSGAAQVVIGTVVRVDLRGRRLRAWVTVPDVAAPAQVDLAPVRRVTGAGPPAALVELARWAAWRWAGRRPHFLRTATAARVVPLVGAAALTTPQPTGQHEYRAAAPAGVFTAPALTDRFAADAWRRRRAVVRTPPGSDDWPLVLGAARLGRALVLVPSLDRARHLALLLARAGVLVARYPGEWAASTAGASTVGARAAAWAPLVDLDAVLVLDEHDEAYQEEASPTWHARDVAVERARRDGAACVLASPAPSLDALATGWPLLVPSRAAERAGWPIVEVVDRRRDDPAAGEWCSPSLARLVASQRRVVVVVNRTGRARMAVCRNCGELARSSAGTALRLDGDGLVDPATGARRPVVCEHCGATSFRRLRLGTEGVAAELERATRRPVVEVTAATTEREVSAGLVVGTEAALHRVASTDAVAFLDFDQELLAPRFAAAEQAMALLVRAARLVGGRQGGGRLLVQTRLPRHPVLEAALHADPGRMVPGEQATRRLLGLPPERAMAVLSGAAAGDYAAELAVAAPREVEVRGPAAGRWQVLAADHTTLCDALAAVARPPGRLRVEVDPRRA
jgi:primosomal protein N' (replication factor Y) (superfamily II helicase)